MTLEEKINFEFLKFYLSEMSCSKDNIFASSDEIEIKKQIKNILVYASKKLSDEEKNTLLMLDNILENAYCFAKNDLSIDNSKRSFFYSMTSWFSSYDISFSGTYKEYVFDISAG